MRFLRQRILTMDNQVVAGVIIRIAILIIPTS